MSDSAASILPVGRSRTPCPCSICVASRAVKDLSGAIDGMIEMGADHEGSLYYLLDEIESVAKSWWAFPVRRRLRRMLRTAAPHRGA